VWGARGGKADGKKPHKTRKPAQKVIDTAGGAKESMGEGEREK